MKRLLVAFFIGLASLTATASPSMADSVTVTIGDNHHDGWNRHHRSDWRRHHYRHRPRCRTKVVRYRHHHRWVVKRTRVCSR